MANSCTIGWTRGALKQFGDAIEHIAKESLLYAERVRLDVIERVRSLSDHPEAFPPDKYKTNNTGNYRAFELHHLRVSYFIIENHVEILRVRHTSRRPQKY